MITTSNTEASVNHEKKLSTHSRSDAAAAEFAKRVRSTRQKLTSELKSHYDFIVCGSGSAGSVVPRRLAVNANISVLLLEAGGDDDIPSVMEANQWHLNIGSQRDWNFVAQPNSCLNGRVIPLDMGKVLRGGLSINLMCWARGHKNDWDFFARETGDKHGSFCWDSLWVWREADTAIDPHLGCRCEEKLFRLTRCELESNSFLTAVPHTFDRQESFSRQS